MGARVCARVLQDAGPFTRRQPICLPFICQKRCFRQKDPYSGSFLESSELRTLKSLTDYDSHWGNMPLVRVLLVLRECQGLHLDPERILQYVLGNSGQCLPVP